MGALDQQQEPQQLHGASSTLQQLEPSAVELPPEEAANISQLIELDLLGDKDKKKTDDDSDEEVCQRFTGEECLSRDGCNCLLNCVPGGGGAGRRPGPGGEEVEQKDPTDASWAPGLFFLILY